VDKSREDGDKSRDAVLLWWVVWKKSEEIRGVCCQLEGETASFAACTNGGLNSTTGCDGCFCCHLQAVGMAVGAAAAAVTEVVEKAAAVAEVDSSAGLGVAAVERRWAAVERRWAAVERRWARTRSRRLLRYAILSRCGRQKN
jgi:hypothetical protein